MSGLHDIINKIKLSKKKGELKNYLDSKFSLLAQEFSYDKDTNKSLLDILNTYANLSFLDNLNREILGGEYEIMGSLMKELYQDMYDKLDEKLNKLNSFQLAGTITERVLALHPSTITMGILEGTEQYIKEEINSITHNPTKQGGKYQTGSRLSDKIKEIYIKVHKAKQVISMVNPSMTRFLSEDDISGMSHFLNETRSTLIPNHREYVEIDDFDMRGFYTFLSFWAAHKLDRVSAEQIESRQDRTPIELQDRTTAESQPNERPDKKPLFYLSYIKTIELPPKEEVAKLKNILNQSSKEAYSPVSREVYSLFNYSSYILDRITGK